MALRTFMDLSCFFNTGDGTMPNKTSTKMQNAGDFKWQFLNNDYGFEIDNNIRFNRKKNYTNKHILKLIIVTIKMFSKNVEPNRLTQ